MYSLKSITKFIFIIVIAISVSHSTFAFDITATEDVSVSATVGNIINITPTDDSGGGGFITSVIFSGDAYPGAVVHIWKNGLPKTTTTADGKGYFMASLQELYSPNVLYTLYAIDKAGGRSIILNYPIVVKKGYVTQVSGIRFAPTISADKVEVKKDGNITIFGYALPNVPIDLVIGGIKDQTFNIVSKNDGTYQTTLTLTDFIKGNYNIHVNYKNDKRISKVIQFTIGDVNILSADLSTNIPGDCNADQVINLIDFSVMAFWYGKDNPPRCVDTNSDNVINLIDFSILAFYWTG